jgi:hypothetical protein
MANLLEQAINCDDADRAARIIQDALGIESSDVADYKKPGRVPLTTLYSGHRGSVFGQRSCFVSSCFVLSLKG